MVPDSRANEFTRALHPDAQQLRLAWATLAFSGTATAVVDYPGLILRFASQAFQQLLGADVDTGRPFDEVVPEWGSNIRAMAHDVVATGVAHSESRRLSFDQGDGGEEAHLVIDMHPLRLDGSSYVVIRVREHAGPADGGEARPRVPAAPSEAPPVGEGFNEDAAAWGARLRMDFLRAQVGIAHVYPDGRVLDANPALTRLTGFSESELKQRALDDIVAPEFLASLETQRGRLATFEIDRFATEVRIVRPDGVERWVELGLSPVEAGDGRVEYLRLTAEDIEARKRNEIGLSAVQRLGDALASAEQELGAAAGLRDALTRVVGITGGALGCDSTALVVRAGALWTVALTDGLPELDVGERLEDDQLAIAVLAVCSAEPVIVADTREDSRTAGALERTPNVRSLMAVPLLTPDAGVVVALFCYSSPRVFEDYEIDFARKISASLSRAARSTRLRDAASGRADGIGPALMPMPDRLARVEFSHAYRGASDSGRGGGDFYDLFEISADEIGVLIGDVWGKGSEAVELALRVRSAVRAHSGGPRVSPSEVLRKVNARVLSDTSADAYVTMLFGVVDRRSGRFRYTNAGHMPSLVVSEERIMELPGTSIILGAFEDARMDESETTLRRDDVLLLYTNGVIGGMGPAGAFGDKRLWDSLRRCGEISPAGIVRCVLEDVLDYTGQFLTDDLALLALRITD